VGWWVTRQGSRPRNAPDGARAARAHATGMRAPKDGTARSGRPVMANKKGGGEAGGEAYVLCACKTRLRCVSARQTTAGPQHEIRQCYNGRWTDPSNGESNVPVVCLGMCVTLKALVCGQCVALLCPFEFPIRPKRLPPNVIPSSVPALTHASEPPRHSPLAIGSAKICSIIFHPCARLCFVSCITQLPRFPPASHCIIHSCIASTNSIIILGSLVFVAALFLIMSH
jgi:hypothetical protein